MVLVTGAGRSGTSSMAGTLNRLGLHVPEPVVGANKNNPRGHYEPQWVVDFHKKYLKEAGVGTMDGDPTAVALAEKVFDRADVRGQIRDWLGRLPADGADVVIKDPRTFWGAQTWTALAREAGYDVRYLTMLRHPAEVVGSRSTHYSKATTDEQHRREDVAHIAGWINANVINEATTRGAKRAFVLYEDLLADWRRTLAPVSGALGLDLDRQLVAGTHHEVDDFIEPSLRRVVATWEGSDVPENLRALADDAWTALVARAHGEIDDDELGTRLDVVRDAYAQLYDDSEIIASNRLTRQKSAARRAARRDALAEATAKAASAGATGSTGRTTSSVARQTEAIRASDLVKEVVRRGTSRVTGKRPS